MTIDQMKMDASVYVDEVDSKGGHLARDRYDMATMGKKPRLNRIFGFMSMLGFTTTLMCTWAAVYFSNFTALIDGGPVTLLYGTIFSWVGALVTAASLGELASMMPTAGGQYHWTAQLAPNKISVFLSWFCGWIAVLGWLANLCAGVFFSGTMTQSIVLFNHTEIPYQRWQGTLMMWAALVVCVAVNTLGAKFLPNIEGFILITYIVGFFAVLIPLITLGEHRDAAYVFGNFTNESGWESNGLVFFIGLISTNLPFIGYDGPAHMAEEVQNASTVVPWCMVTTVIINGVLGLATTIAFLFCLGDPNDAITAATETGFDFIEVFYAATNSYVGTSFMTAILIALVTAASFCFLASASRQTWAFARDRGLPFSDALAKVNTIFGIPMPLRAIAFSATIAAIIGLINIGSTVAFNAIVSLTIAGLFTSYLIPITLILIKRLRGDEIAWGPWKMGKIGAAVNIASAIFLIISIFFSFFPPGVPVEPVTMNWSSVVFVGALAIGFVYYAVRGRKVYRGPVIEREDEWPVGA